MARGKRAKISKPFKKVREDDDKAKPEQMKNESSKRLDEKSSIRTNLCQTYFKSEEIQEICATLNIEELGDQHCFLGAVVIGKFDVVKKLLRDGYCIDRLDENRETALMHAVKHFRLEMVDFLLTRGADILLTDGEGNNCLLLAAQNTLWDQDSFSGLWLSVLEHPRLRPDHTNKAGYSLLHYLTKRQWVTALELLLNTPLSLDCRTSKGVTPLIMAASRGDYVLVKTLMEAGADFTIEDQQMCTALCYAVAFHMQKNMADPNGSRCLELILAAVNDENSKLPLEYYLQRRVDLLMNPPKSKAEFSKTVSGVIVHILTFFARYIYSGLELLLELSVFHKLREAVERHVEDALYTAALLGVLLELVRHCDCCCQGLSQVELADTFFIAGLGNTVLEILHRYGTRKTAMIKAVFLPLLYMCTSDSYRARTWLENNHQFLQAFFNKYMRSFPLMFLEPNGDPHLEIEKKCLSTFQNIMKVLKTQGHIVTKEEHLKAEEKLKEDMTLEHSLYTVMKKKSSNGLLNSLRISPEKKLSVSYGKRKNRKGSPVYSSIMQYNFEKLNIVQMNKDAINTIDKEKISNSFKKESNDNPENSTIKNNKFKKSRIAIKEIQDGQLGDTSNNDIADKIPKSELVSDEKQSSQKEIFSEETEIKHILENNLKPDKKPTLSQEEKDRFSNGYQLFQMEDELLSDSNTDDNNPPENTCKWLDAYSASDVNKTVSDTEVADSINHLEEIFRRIIARYDSTWKKQYEEGYREANGDCEDLLKLMTVLPALENYYMNKLIQKWNNFCRLVRDHARKNHLVYAAKVSEMQLFLLEFEAELEERNIKVLNEDENSSLDSYLDTESIIKTVNSSDVNILSSVKHNESSIINIKCFNNENKKTAKDEINVNMSVEETKQNQLVQNNITLSTDFVGNMYITDNEDLSIWDGNIEHFKVNQKPNENASENKQNIIKSQNFNESSTEIVKDEIANEISNLKNEKLLPCERNNETEAIEDSIITESRCGSQNIFERYIQFGSNIKKTLREQEINSIPSYKLKPLSKPPPGFEHFPLLSECFESLSSVLAYSGTKFESQIISLSVLPACSKEFLDDGSLILASMEYRMNFKLFTGFNFGDVELGLTVAGIPLAVRRFEKHNNLCNKTISKSLYKLVRSMFDVSSPHILPYLSCYDQPYAVVYTTPLCSQDLGQYIRQIRTEVVNNSEKIAVLTHLLINMVKQMMSGLHYLHTRDRPIIHGNMKPSNIMVDDRGALRVAEFGLHEILFQQQRPAITSQIWWARECLVVFYNSLKYECTQQSDIQTAGMLCHYILSIGQHPYGQNLEEIIVNIKNGIILSRIREVIATDLIYWMLSNEPDKRPTTYDVLRHVLFWSSDTRWDFLMTCCGLGPKNETLSLPFDRMYSDLDILGKVKDVNTKWISVLKESCERQIGSNVFEDSPSGLLSFLNKNLENWTNAKDIFLELFPVLPLNLFRLLEQTVWIDHPQFEPFTTVDPLS